MLPMYNKCGVNTIDILRCRLAKYIKMLCALLAHWYVLEQNFENYLPMPCGASLDLAEKNLLYSTLHYTM